MIRTIILGRLTAVCSCVYFEKVSFNYPSVTLCPFVALILKKQTFFYSELINAKFYVFFYNFYTYKINVAEVEVHYSLTFSLLVN